MIGLWLLLSCGGAPQQPAASPDEPPVGETGWGAVFWRDDRAWKVGGGDWLTGPRAAGRVRASGATGPCGGVAVEGAPDKAVIASPEGRQPTAPEKPPAVPAALVERAAWRLDEALPPRDEYSPARSAPDPALQRGVRVGSVVKTRRKAAPPVVITAGVRDCHGAVALLDSEGATALWSETFDDTCEPIVALPASDLDGDGQRETAVFNDTSIRLYRLVEAPGPARLEPLGTWTCPDVPTP